MLNLRKMAQEEASKICRYKDCNICYLSIRKKQALESNDFAIMAEFIEELLERECNIAEDLNYYKAVHDGTWPQSVDILSKSLQKAKENSNWQTEAFKKILNSLDRNPDCT